MTMAERAFRLLLWAYPADFRRDYGREMTLVFRDQRRQPDARGVRFWAELLRDVGRSAPVLRVEAFGVLWNRFTQIEGEKMKLMAILAVLIGALEAANALAEAWTGGIGNGDRYALMWGTMAGLAGVLLLTSGIGLARRFPRARALAQCAALICLAVFTSISVIQPRMSLLATLLGIGFPVGLGVFLYWTRGRDQSPPRIA